MHWTGPKESTAVTPRSRRVAYSRRSGSPCGCVHLGSFIDRETHRLLDENVPAGPRRGDCLVRVTAGGKDQHGVERFGHEVFPSFETSRDTVPLANRVSNGGREVADRR